MSCPYGQQKPQSWQALGFSIPFWQGWLKPQAGCRLLLSVQPFANEVANYTRHNRKSKSYEFFRRSPPLSLPVQGWQHRYYIMFTVRGRLCSRAMLRVSKIFVCIQRVRLCDVFIRATQFNRQRLLNCHGRISVCLSGTQRKVFIISLRTDHFPVAA